MDTLENRDGKAFNRVDKMPWRWRRKGKRHASLTSILRKERVLFGGREQWRWGSLNSDFDPGWEEVHLWRKREKSGV